jgi:hypothetical protein
MIEKRMRVGDGYAGKRGKSGKIRFSVKIGAPAAEW